MSVKINSVQKDGKNTYAGNNPIFNGKSVRKSFVKSKRILSDCGKAVASAGVFSSMLLFAKTVIYNDAQSQKLMKRSAEMANSQKLKNKSESDRADKIKYMTLADGKMRFRSEEEAIEYAKGIICKYLQRPEKEQVEVTVAVRGPYILGIAEGDNESVDPRKIRGVRQLFSQKRLMEPRDIILLHGHPDMYGKGKTSPLSVNDISVVLGRFNVKTIVAYNSAGEYSKAEIADYDKFINRSLNLISKTEEKYVREKVLSKEENHRYIELGQIIESQNKCDTNLKKIYEKLKIKSEKLGEIYRQTEGYADTLHKMYRNEAENFGIKYETNYSGLGS